MISRPFPFSYMATESPLRSDHGVFYANGIFADTGLPLCTLSPTSAARLAKGLSNSKDELYMARRKYEVATFPSYGPIGEISAANLSEAGWGIIFHAQANEKVKKGLSRLIEHRRREARDLCKVFENDDGYHQGETCTEWLARHGTSLMPVNPYQGVPFYLLIVGSPTEIPFEFQYLLDIYWGVGRVHFDDSDDYEKYAESVIDYEQSRVLPNIQSAAIFSTRHEFDQATQMFASEVAKPLIEGHDGLPPLGTRQNFQLQSFIGESATKEQLTELLRGGPDGATPALLFTGSHGMGFRPDDARLRSAQGALVCQNWNGWGDINSSHWFEAQDVPADARLQGLIHFMFACYGAGCPQYDDFVIRDEGERDEIAPAPLIASLPQKLLAHPKGGALASIGHVDRAWSYSFRSSKSAQPQIQAFRDVLGRVLSGERLGQATDQFDVRRAALSFELADLLRAVERKKAIPDWEVANLWMARNDARNYIVLGDPAIRLRVEQFGIKAAS